jgi:hypothetical protein
MDKAVQAQCHRSPHSYSNEDLGYANHTQISLIISLFHVCLFAFSIFECLIHLAFDICKCQVLQVL